MLQAMDNKRTVKDGWSVALSSHLPLYWKVCLINGGVLVGAAIILVVSPATVSPTPTPRELAILAGGLVVILVANALLLRSTLTPLDELTQRVNGLVPGDLEQRLPESGSHMATALARSFNGLLDRADRERSRASAQAIAAQERERQRIARELHDEVGQRLTVVLLGLKRALGAGDSDMADELALVRESARSSLVEVRRIAQGLRPGVLDDLGIYAALEAMVKEICHDTPLDIDLVLPKDRPPISHDAELVIFRVVQEALTNVVRHTSSEHATVSMTVTHDALSLLVRDDGHVVANLSSGNGIRGISERALSVGGRASVTPDAGGGVRVELTIPVKVRAS